MSKISAFRPEDCTFMPNHADVDGYLYKYEFDSKLWTQIKDSSALVAGNRLFNSFMTGSDGTALRLSFDGTNYLDTYIMYGGLYAHNGVDGATYNADGVMILYCVDPTDHTIVTVKKINLCDNTNACMSLDAFIQPTTFMGASSYVTLDDDHTSAIMVSVGGLTPLVAVQSADFKYDYIETQNSLHQWDSVYSTWKDMTLYDIKGANTGQVVHGYGGRTYGGVIQYGWRLNLRKGVSSKQHEYSWNSLAGYYFGYHLGGLWFYGDDHWGDAYYDRYAFRMPVYFDSYPYNSVSNSISVYRGILFGHRNKLYMHGGGYEYSDPENIYSLNLETNTQTAVYWCPSVEGGPPTRKNFDGVKHPTKPLMYFFGGQDDGDGALNSAQVYDITENELYNLSPMPVGLYHHTATLVDDRVYIVGGEISPGVYNTNIYEYNIALDSWKTVKTGVRPRYKHTSAEYDGTIFVIGGLYDVIPVDSNQIPVYHEIDAFVVKSSSNMPGWKYIDFTDRDATPSTYGCTTEYEGLIYFYGGNGDVDDGTAMVRFDPQTLTWTKLADNTMNSSTACAMAAVDGTIYVTGGFDYPYSPRVFCYIIDEDRWEEGPPLPTAHMFPSMITHDGTMWIRITDTTGGFAKELYMLDHTANQQVAKAVGITARTKICFAADGTKLYVFGGHDGFHIGGYFHPMTNIEVYDMATDSQSNHSTTYADTGPFKERAKAMAHRPIMRDGKIWLFGGQDDGGNPVHTTDVFNPATGLFEIGDGVFGGGEPLQDRYEEYHETIGTYVVGDKLYTFYGAGQGYDATFIGVYTFPEAFTDEGETSVTYEEVGFFDAAAFSFAQTSYFLDISTNVFKQVFAINPYPPRFGHHSVKMGSDILSMGGILKRNVSMIDQLPIPPIMITEVVLKDLTSAVDLVADITNGEQGLGSALTDKTSDQDFGSDTTAGVDGWYALINILPTDDMTNIVFEVMGGSITRAVLHYPGEASVYDQSGLVFPVDVSLVGVSSPGPVCAYLRVPQGTVIKHIWCSK